MRTLRDRARGRGVLLAGIFALMLSLFFAGEAYAKTKTTKLTLYYDSATQASKTLKASGLTAKKATWKTSKKKVATITKTGKVTVKKAGKATITAKQGKKTYKFVVTSKKVTISKTKATLEEGKALALKLTGDKIKATKSSNTAVATVDKTGKVKAVKAGSATITLTSKKNKKYTCKVTVKAVPVNVTGTYDIHVQGYDYGAGVDYATLRLSAPVEGLDASDLVVSEHKQTTDWSAAGFPVVEADFAREVTGVEVAADGKTVKVYLACDPNNGSPLLYTMATGRNTWCDPYQLSFTLAKGAQVTSAGKAVTSFSVSGKPGAKTTSADEWTIDSYTTTGADNNVTYRYAKWDPADDSDTLVVWLHGAGEGGTEADGTDPYITILANKVVALSGDDFQTKVGGAHVVAPQCPTMWMDIDGNGTYISAENSNEVRSYYTQSLEEFIDYYAEQVGATKVVLAGCSNGGFMTLWMGLHRPARYTAIVPICEAVPDSLITDEQIKGIKNLPMYFVYSEDDTTVDPNLCEKPTIERLLMAGASDLHVSTTERVIDTSGQYKDSEGEPYEYNGHWSWIYFDNDECVCNGADGCGLGAWDFIANAEPRIYDVTFGATVTDAGQYVDKMVIDYGDDVAVNGVENDTYTVHMTSTVDYGAAKDQPYAYYDASKALEVVKTEVDGGVVTVYFNQAQAPTLTWLAEGRNYPAVLGFTVEQSREITLVPADGVPKPVIAQYTCDATSYEDLDCDEVAAFEDVQAEINYQLHEGTNDKLIVWFHGNGEGDFPTKDTNNNIAQILANRGGVAWVSEEAQGVFGDAYVMAFQAPNMWYYAIADNLLEPCFEEIQQVISQYGINPNEVYLSGCSAGGFMSTRMVIAYPDLFKAAMINCPALDAANARTGTDNSNPTDEELAQLQQSKTAIWLVQGETDSSVDPDECAKRVFKIAAGVDDLNDPSLIVSAHAGTEGIASGFTTYETTDGKYKLSLYETVDLGDVTGISGEIRQGGKLKFAEDYDMDGTLDEVKYSDHWSWIYTLRNNPVDQSDTHIWQWALSR